jgi:type III secretion protein R
MDSASQLLTSTTGGAAPGSLSGVLVLLVALALLPFLLTMVTSFAKLVIIGGILRQALGTPQIPPASVITGLAIILSIHIMAPTMVKIGQNLETLPQATSEVSLAERYASAAQVPLREFLSKNASPKNVALFERLHLRAAERQGVVLTPLRPGTTWHDLIALTPGFVLTELYEAFVIGFLIFIPFLVIDLVVSNVLLAMGMQWLSPMAVSLPLKLMLFVMIDGWRLILQGVVLSYS